METIWKQIIITTAVFIVLELVAFLKHKKNINIVRPNYEISGVVFYKEWVAYVFVWLYVVVIGFIFFIEYENIYYMIPLFGVFAYFKQLSRRIGSNQDLPNYLDQTFYSHISKIPQMKEVSIPLSQIKEIKVRRLLWMKRLEIYGSESSILIPIYSKNFATIIDILVKKVEPILYQEMIEELRQNYRFDRMIHNIWNI